MTIQRYLLDTGKAVLISVCCVCKGMTGIKKGNGVCGVSHSYCDECLDAARKKLAARSQ